VDLYEKLTKLFGREPPEQPPKPERLALYNRRDGDTFDLAAVYLMPYVGPPRRHTPDGGIIISADDPPGSKRFLVVAYRHADELELVEEHDSIEDARSAAVTFVGTTKDDEWVLQGSPLPWIEDVAEAACTWHGRVDLGLSRASTDGDDH
jgi:hypothetical protein